MNPSFFIKITLALLLLGCTVDGSLHKAAEAGNLAKVKQLVEAGADVEAKDEDGWTALHWAAKEGHPAVVEYLLSGDRDRGLLEILKGLFRGIKSREEAKANVNAQDNKDFTALHYAAGMGYLAVVRVLVEAGAYLNAESKYGETVLHRATQEGHLEVVRYLEKNKTADQRADELLGKETSEQGNKLSPEKPATSKVGNVPQPKETQQSAKSSNKKPINKLTDEISDEEFEEAFK